MLVSREVQGEARGERAHPEEHDFERFVRGQLSRGECCQVVRHLLAGCPECRAAARTLWVLGNDSRSPQERSRPTERTEGAHDA